MLVRNVLPWILFAAVIAAGVAFGLTTGIPKAHAATSPLGCAAGQTRADLPALYSGDVGTVYYDYKGADEAKILGTVNPPKGLEGFFGSAPSNTPVALITLAYIPGQAGSYIYVFDANDCFIVQAQLRNDELKAIFDEAGLAFPIGATYYKTPGSP